MKKIKHTLITIVTVFLITVFLPVAGASRAFNKSDIGVTKVNAEELRLPVEGRWGTCPWKIDINGVLTIGKGFGEDITNNIMAWRPYASQITSVEITGTVYLPSEVCNMFEGCSSLETLDGLSKFDTSKVTNMYAMFWNCSSLKTLDGLSKFDTSNVTSMEGMFAGCSGLTALDVSNFNTSKVTNMRNMFEDCSSLKTLDVSNFNTSKVTNMRNMFEDCSSLKTLDGLSKFDTSNVTDMGNMFGKCSSLTTLDVSKFDTSKVTYMGSMFDRCSGLTALDVSNFDTSNVTDMLFMFQTCSKLTTLDLSNFDTSKVTRMWCMFNGCSGLTALDLSNFDTRKVTNMDSMFSGCSKLAKLSLGSKTLLKSGCGLPLPDSNDPYTGNWTKTSPYNHINMLSTDDLISKYSTSGSPESAVWVWEKNGVPISPVTSDGITVNDPLVETIVLGDPDEDRTFTFVFRAKDEGYPMPDGSDGTEKRVTITGAGRTEIGSIAFTEPGTYTYYVSEEKGGDEDYTYDTAVYQVVYEVTSDSSGLHAERMILKDGSASDESSFVFTNEYNRDDGSKTHANNVDHKTDSGTAGSSGSVISKSSVTANTGVNGAGIWIWTAAIAAAILCAAAVVRKKSSK